jgi:hypothetical protein
MQNVYLFVYLLESRFFANFRISQHANLRQGYSKMPDLGQLPKASPRAVAIAFKVVTIIGQYARFVSASVAN